jgi:hypothetical protein
MKKHLRTNSVSSSIPIGSVISTFELPNTRAAGNLKLLHHLSGGVLSFITFDLGNVSSFAFFCLDSLHE